MHENWKNTLVFFINGKKIVDHNVDPSTNLLTYLRSNLFLTGTKDGCSEGGCGACTVMISRLNRENGSISHFSANACLLLVVQLHGLSVTTIEGIGSIKTRLHPIQEQLVKSHGIQCGFCTPGFVMSMYSLLRNNPSPSLKDIEKNLAGNLCRCTGYRPIVEAFRSFSSEFQNEEICSRENCSKKLQKCCRGGNGSCSDSQDDISSSISTGHHSTQDVIFPPELKLLNGLDKESLHFQGCLFDFYRPTSLEELLMLKKRHPTAQIVAGNTKLGIDMKFQGKEYSVLISTYCVRELHTLKEDKLGVVVGSSTSLTEVKMFLEDIIKKLPEYQTRIFVSFVEMVKKFACEQIRNVATLGGNIMTESNISDLLPIMLAANCKVLFKSQDKEKEVVCDDRFLTGYRTSNADEDAVLISIFLPFTKQSEYFMAFKQSRRRDVDLAIVNCAFRVHIEDSIIQDIHMAFGGMRSTIVVALNTAKKLRGCTWNKSVLDRGITSLLDELALTTSAPVDQFEYRRALVIGFFFKFVHKIDRQIGEALSDGDFDEFSIEPSSSTQMYEKVSPTQLLIDPIGRPIQNVAAQKLSTGEAIFTDDIPPFKNELQAALVLSSRPNAVIIDIDESAALKMEGVHAFVSAKDMTEEMNRISDDEPIFANKEVHCVGQVIGIIVANTRDVAKMAAKLVRVQYEDRKPIITIQDAIEASSYTAIRQLSSGDAEKALKNAEYRMDGTCYVGGQEHFYMEPNCHLAVPKDEDEVEIVGTLQNLDLVQERASHALGIPANQIVCRVKRVGGAFGGKDTRALLLALPVVVAAKKIGRPIRITVDRHEDMLITGNRSPMQCQWEAGFNSEGRISVVHATIYANGGCTADISPEEVELSLLKFDNTYKIDNWKLEGFCCKTNLTSNTSQRGTGAPQAIVFMEEIISKVADHLKINPREVREKNFYSSMGDINHFGMKLDDVTLHRCWNEVIQKSNYEKRIKEVNDYNKRHLYKKRGMCLLPMKYGNSIPISYLNQGDALIQIYKDGSVLITYGGIEFGQGLHTKMIQVASRVLQIPTNKINVLDTATDKIPNAPPTAGSISSDVYGMAVKEACEKIVLRLKPYREKFSAEGWKVWINKAYQDGVALIATGKYMTPNLTTFDFTTGKGQPFNYFSYGAAVSEVEVDCITGDHFILRSDIVFDVGKSLNPAIDIGQIEGAFMHGIGLYTLEEQLYTPDGDLITKGPAMNKIPGVRDIPRKFNVSLLQDAANEKAVYSSKAIGEPPLLLAASVFFALREAVKAYRGDNAPLHWHSPATSRRIRMACEDQLTEKLNLRDKILQFKP